MMFIEVESTNLSELQDLLKKQELLCGQMLDNAERIGRSLTKISAKEIQPPVRAGG